MSLDLARAALRLAGLSAEVGIEPIALGESGDNVFRARTSPVSFIKIAARFNPTGVRSEAAVLRWIAGRFPTPRLLWTGNVEDRTAFVVEALPGFPASGPEAGDPESVVRKCLRALVTLHALPITDCPLNQRLPAKLAAAKARLDHGLVNEGDFDEERLGLSGEDVWKLVLRARPEQEDIVFTHGDACLPNFIVSDGPAIGVVDLGRAGPADRHQDLALFRRSLRFNYPQLDADRLIREVYPLAIDEDRMRFFQLLDELF